MSRLSRLMCAAAIAPLVACAGAEFRPRAVGNSFTGVAGEAELVAEGRANFRGGNFALAVNSFRRALRQNPQSLEAHNGLAASYDRLGRFDLARRYYEEGLALAPADPRLRANYAISLRMQGRHQEAAQLERESAYLAGADITTEPPARQALAELGPSDEVTIVLPPPAPVEPPRVTQALPRLERISTAEIALITRPEPSRATAREIPARQQQAEARPIPVRLVRDTAREVVIEIGAEPEPSVPAAPPRPVAARMQTASVAVALPAEPRPAPVAAVAAPISTPTRAAPVRASPRPAPVATPRPVVARAQTASVAAAPPPQAEPRQAPVVAAVAAPISPPTRATRALPRPAPILAAVAPPASTPSRAVPAPLAPPAAPAAPRPVERLAQAAPRQTAPAPVGVRATGTVRATPAPAPRAPEPIRAISPAVAESRASRPALARYPGFAPLARVSRSEDWRPLDRARQLAWAPLQSATPQPALAQARLPMRILNAVGRRGQAARMQRHLVAGGWDRTSIGDARSRRVRSILLSPPGTLSQAQRLARSLPFQPRLIRTGRPGQLLLVLGRDALPLDDRLRHGFGRS